MEQVPRVMKMPAPCVHPLRVKTLKTGLPRRQQGVVLIIALVLLVVMSMLSITSMRNVSSSESLAGNVRTTELATQAADIALRFCEEKALIIAAEKMPDSTPEQWNTLANWDTRATEKLWKAEPSPLSSTYVLPTESVNKPDMNETYKRRPECMVEQVDMAVGAGADLGTSTFFYVVTARGFGPEVAAVNAVRSRPVGAEVWLQSHISIQKSTL